MIQPQKTHKYREPKLFPNNDLIPGDGVSIRVQVPIGLACHEVFKVNLPSFTCQKRLHLKFQPLTKIPLIRMGRIKITLKIARLTCVVIYIYKLYKTVVNHPLQSLD